MAQRFNWRNPNVLAAARANLLDVLTPEAYAHLARLQDRMTTATRRILLRTGVEAHVVSAGAKGCVTYTQCALRNYRDFGAASARVPTIPRCSGAGSSMSGASPNTSWGISFSMQGQRNANHIAVAPLPECERLAGGAEESRNVRHQSGSRQPLGRRSGGPRGGLAADGRHRASIEGRPAGRHGGGCRSERITTDEAEDAGVAT